MNVLTVLNQLTYKNVENEDAAAAATRYISCALEPCSRSRILKNRGSLCDSPFNSGGSTERNIDVRGVCVGSTRNRRRTSWGVNLKMVY